MRFRLIPMLPDGGGDLEITAETGTEVRVLIKEFKLFCVDGCDVHGRLKALHKEQAALESGTHTIVRMHKHNTMNGTRAWYAQEHLTQLAGGRRICSRCKDKRKPRESWLCHEGPDEPRTDDSAAGAGPVG